MSERMICRALAGLAVDELTKLRTQEYPNCGGSLAGKVSHVREAVLGLGRYTIR